MEFMLKSAFLIGIIYSFYRLFLQKETFFKSIRAYFIIGILVTIVLPLISVPIYINATQIIPFVPEITETPINFNTETFIETTTVIKSFNWVDLLISIYFIGLVIFTLKFILEISSLYQLIYKSNKVRNGKITFIETLKSISPFSVFNYIIYTKNQFTTSELVQIIAHEKIHVKQLHTYDMLLVHLLVIVQWFNPFVWLYKKDVQQNLEFLADKYAQDTLVDSVHGTEQLKKYQYLLLKTSVKKNPFTLSNNFYNSLIKKRIIMLQKKPSKKVNQLKYILLLPLLVLFLYAFNTKEIVIPVHKTLFPNLVNFSENKLVVIDVSHGGKDTGAIVNNVLEKDIVLKISKAIKTLYKGKSKLIFTRENDEFIILSDRIAKINKLNPDLVISLHVNKAISNENVNGLVAYASESNVAFRKSKLIATKLLNTIANENLKIKGFSKGNLRIIQKVNCPAVLLELGFLSNNNDRNYINSDKGQTEIAKSIIAFINNKETENYFAQSKAVKIINPIPLKPILSALKKESVFNKELDSGILIQSKTTDKELQEIQEKFMQKNKVSLRIYDVKRNDNAEIIALKFEGKSKNTSSNYSFNQDDPISNILLNYDKNTGKIIIKNVDSDSNNKEKVTSNFNTRIVKFLKDVNHEEEDHIIILGDDSDNHTPFIDELKKMNKKDIKVIKFDNEDTYSAKKSNDSKTSHKSTTKISKIVTIKSDGDLNKLFYEIDKNSSSGELSYNNVTYFYNIKNNKTTFYDKFGNTITNKTSKKLLKLLKKKLR